MKILYSDTHRLHHGAAELNDGKMQPANEKPQRIDMILARLDELGLTDRDAPDAFDRPQVERLHPAHYLDFLEGAHAAWREHHGDCDALPLVWPVRDLRGDVRPQHIDGLLGYYSGDSGTPITKGTWPAITGSAMVAISGARHLLEAPERPVFSLCRPPGHHASADIFVGYCYLNNAALAAQKLRDSGVGRVAILDVDYHHGNGTQALFYDRGDVLVVNLHADPRVEFPFFLGHADETGSGAGEGATVNLPLPFGTRWADYAPALDRAIAAVRNWGAEALVVSLGCDTYEHDPISHFKLSSDDFSRMGETIGRGLRLPTQVVMEGGYAVDALGINVGNFLTGLLAGR